MKRFTRDQLRLGQLVRLGWLALALGCCAFGQFVFAQQSANAVRMNELRSLRDQLKLSDSLRGADLLVVLNERVVAEAAQQLIGLEILLSSGSLLRVTSVESELKAAAGVIKIGVQTKSSVTINLQLTARISSGELKDNAMRLPIHVTDVNLGNGRFSSLFIKTLFGEWLKAETWNSELPAIEIPLELSDTLQIPASHFDVAGTMPMEIETPPLQSPLKFSLTSLLILDKRMVLALRTGQPAQQTAALQTSLTGANDYNQAAIEDEIARLSQNLFSISDMRVRVSRRVITESLAQLAAAQPTDLKIRLKPGRLRSEEVTAGIRVTNYTDVESGQGQADISNLSADQIAAGRINIRLSGQGALDANLRGREYGLPYKFSPHVTFTIKDQIIPMQFRSESDRLILSAAPGSTLPIDFRLTTTILGREVGIDQTARLRADRWLSGIELPSVFVREILLPRRLEVNKEGGLEVVSKQPLKYALANLRVKADEDALDIIADVKLARP